MPYQSSELRVVTRAPSRNAGKQKRGLLLLITAQAGSAFVPYLKRQLPRAYAMLSAPPLRELSLALVNEQRMSALHEQYMGISGPTDVLTFPLELDARRRAIGGEVIVCVTEARRRAVEHGVAVKDELLLYALHGMLHLCGFDDRTDRGFVRMHRAEDMILTQLGVGPIFHHRTSASAKKRGRAKS